MYTYQDIITYLHFILLSKYFNGNKHDPYKWKSWGNEITKATCALGEKFQRLFFAASLFLEQPLGNLPSTPTLHLSAISTLTLGKGSVLPKDLQFWTRWTHQMFSIQPLYNSACKARLRSLGFVPLLTLTANQIPKKGQRLQRENIFGCPNHLSEAPSHHFLTGFKGFVLSLTMKVSEALSPGNSWSGQSKKLFGDTKFYCPSLTWLVP